MRKLFSISFILAIIAGIWLIPASVKAADVFRDACNTSGAAASAVCQDKADHGNPLTGSNGILRKLAQTIAIIAGIVAVIVLTIAGLTFVSAGGETGKVTQAQHMVQYTIVGLLVIGLADSIVSFVLSKL